MKYRSASILPKLVALFLVIALFTRMESKAQILINEVVASNSQGISDEDGEYPDWIELYNPSGNSINLQGYGISDDAGNPFKYVLPNIELAANEYYLLFASDKDRGSNSENEPKFWETVVRQGDAAKYIVPTSSVSSSWINPEFDDSDWQDGTFGFGYGDDDDATEVPNGTISVFTRATLSIEDISIINDLLLHIDFDDGYVAYLNGQEISRFNMVGDSPLPFDSGTQDFISDPWLVRGVELPTIELGEFKNLLVDGENVLAIQVHNTNAQSSDMSLIPFLSVARSERPTDSRGIAEEITIEASGLSYPHLNFKLSAEGETVFLTNSDSIFTDSLQYPFLKTDESYGRSEADENVFYIFQSPTPLGINNSEGFSTRLADPEPNMNGGVYPGSIELSINGTSSGSIVYFTTNGSTPTEESEVFGINPRTVSSTTTFKFRAIESGSLPSNVITQTYLIGENHDLPVVSVSTPPDNLWSNQTGIYVEGTNGISGNCTGPRNWNQDWEIPVHIELFEKNGALGFSSGAGAKIFGGCSRINPAKSLSIFFRGEYGNSELNYKLFEEKDIDTFQAFILRNSGNDFNDTHFRDGLMKTLAEGSEIDYQAFRPSVVYLNGEYWGIHNIREKVNEHFLASNSNVKSDDIDLAGPYIDDYIFGQEGAFREFYDEINAADMRDQAEYESIERLVDINNYIDYMAAQIYYANTDWPGNNIKYWRNGASNGKWRWILYDTDFGFNHFNGGNHDGSLGDWESHNTLRFALLSNRDQWPTYPWSTQIFRKFVQNDEFIKKFVNRMSDLMNTSFKPSYVNTVIDSLSQIIDSEMPAHKERWGGSIENWNSRVNGLKNFANNRSSNMREFLRDEFGLSISRNITVHTSDKNHGIIRVNRIEPDTYPWSGQYFSGLPVTLIAIPKRGYTFTGWSGASTSTDHAIEGSAGSTYMANFKPAEGETRDVVINEIMYNDSDEFNSGDWIELYNTTDYDINLSGWTIKDEDDTHQFVFTSGTEINAGSYIVIAADFEEFNSTYEIEFDHYGELGFSLAGGSDQVRLYDNTGILVDSLQYQDEAPWDANADGTGYTLELKDVSLDNAEATSWSASIQSGGSPGAANSILVSNEDQKSIPSEISLLQNYPNPFNPSTNITFKLPEQARIKLTVFDLLGRKVSSLADEIRSAGTHIINWNAGELSSGVYFYKLEVGNKVLTRRMLLIK